jgi:outer membrane protein assembly factor BamB
VAISLGLSTTQPPSGQVAAYAVTTGAPLWKQELGANTQGAIFAAGSVFVLATNAVSLEARDAPAGLTIDALQPADGSVIWRRTLTDTDLLAPILYSQGTLFVISAQFVSTGMGYALTALDAATGSQRWQKALSIGTLTGGVAGDGAVYLSSFAGHIPADRSPRVVMANVPASAADSTRSPFSPGEGVLIAYSANDGTQLWQTTGYLTAQAELAGTLYATVGEQQPSGMTNFRVRAYRASSGGQLWQSSILGSGDMYQDKPIVSADASAAYVFDMPESQPSVRALSGADGRGLWSTPLNGLVASSVAGLGSVFAGAVTFPPAVARTQVRVGALDAVSGATIWSISLDKAQGVSLALL